MATRFYFGSSEAAAVSPTISSTDWGHINASPIRRRLLATTPDTSAMTDTSTLGITYDSADHNVDMNAFAFQHVSDALAAQTLSGNVTAQLLLRELTANDNLKLTIKAYVVNNDGSSVVGTLLAITRDADE